MVQSRVFHAQLTKGGRGTSVYACRLYRALSGTEMTASMWIPLNFVSLALNNLPGPCVRLIP